MTVLAEEMSETADLETSSEAYAGRFPGAVGEFLLEPQTRGVLDLLAPWTGAHVLSVLSVLDVGGGHGQLAVPLVRRGYQVTVAGSREICRNRLDRLLEPGSFDFRTVDLLDLPFPDRAFDAVVSVRLLAHAERWQRLLAEMCRVARTAVVFDYSDTRSFNRLYGHLFRWKRSFEGDTRPFRCFRPGEPAAECARHGFGRPVERREHFVPMVVHRKLKSVPVSRTMEKASGALGLTRRFGSPVLLRVERG